MRPLEYTSVVVPILKYLNSLHGCKALNIHGNVFGERGTPDIIGCINGRMFAFECKRDSREQPEAIQAWRIAEWQTAGAIAARVDSVQEVDAILKEHGLVI